MGDIVKKPVVDVTGMNLHFSEGALSLSYYLKDVRKYSLLTAEQERELFERVKKGDDKAVNEISEANQRFVLAVAKRFSSGSNLMDLVQEGNMGMLDAIKRYNPNMKSKDGEPIKFLSFASWYIRRNISFYLINNSSLVRKTNNVKTIFKINKIKNTFYLENGRQPSNAEVCEIIENEHNIKIKDLSYLYDVETKSLSMSYNEDSTKEVFENSSLFNEKSASLNGYVDTAEKEYTKQLIKAYLDRLNPRERTIVECFFGIDVDREYTLEEIADELGLTRERVRQIKTSSVRKLKKYAGSIAV